MLQHGRNHEPIIILGTMETTRALPIITYDATKLPIKRVYSYMDAIDGALTRDILELGRDIKLSKWENR